MAFSLDQFYKLNQRALIWLILLALLWLMRDFFGLVFLTFVLAFFAAPAAKFLETRLRAPHWAALTAIYLVMLLALVSFVRFVTPSVISEANRLVTNFGVLEQRVMEVNDRFAQHYEGLQKPMLGMLRSALDEAAADALRADVQAQAQLLDLPVDALLHFHAGAAVDADARVRLETLSAYEEQRLLHHMLLSQGRVLREHLPGAINLLYQALVTTLVALLFSCLILADRARLTRQIEALRNSRVRDFYDEAAQPVLRFGVTLGRGLQAQAMIALVNTTLTLGGLLLLQIPSVAMLSVIVFVCSFIPVLGVFISTVPIVLVALNADGLSLALFAVAMIVVVHAVEAYLLNPQIYGHHLKLNPVLSLMILFIAYHAFGVWGMLLGVPVARYFLHDVLQVATVQAEPAKT